LVRIRGRLLWLTITEHGSMDNPNWLVELPNAEESYLPEVQAMITRFCSLEAPLASIHAKIAEEQALAPLGGEWEGNGPIYLTPMLGARIMVKKVGWEWRFSVHTQIHGPGLHMAFYQLLQHLSPILKVTYKMDDPAQFSKDMDEARLTRFYQQELKDIGRELAAQPVNARMQVHWALPGYSLVEGAGVAGPLSRWGRSQFMARCQEDLDALTEDFYVAPHVAQDGVFHRNQALLTLQNEITYLRKDEAPLAAQVCQDLEMASRLYPSLALPLEEYERCAAMAGLPVKKLPNPALSWGLIGYRREPLRHDMDGFSWVHYGHFEESAAPREPWRRLGDGLFICHWAIFPYSADKDPHSGYPTLEDAPLFKGLAAPELAQDDASFGLKCSRRLGDKLLMVLISFEAPYTWQDVYDFLNSVKVL
jgi:hypothetical protein